MVGHTHRYGRYLLRKLVGDATLYTEMLVDNSLIHGPTRKLLEFDESEHPVIAQIAGTNPDTMATAAALVESYGYDGININVGCPSPRVRAGGFGAVLMENPLSLCEIVDAIQDKITIPLSIKCRIGTERRNSYDRFSEFIETVSTHGVQTFIVHARIAVLNGLTTAQNLNVPPLRYDYVEKFKRDHPELTIVLNGGLTDVTEIQDVLTWADGIMIGRLALKHPRQLAWLMSTLNNDNTCYDPFQLAMDYCEYANPAFTRRRNSPSKLIQPLLNLFEGFKGAKKYKNFLTTNVSNFSKITDLIHEALKEIAKSPIDHAQAHS